MNPTKKPLILGCSGLDGRSNEIESLVEIKNFFGGVLRTPLVGYISWGFGPSALEICHVSRFRETLKNWRWPWHG